MEANYRDVGKVTVRIVRQRHEQHGKYPSANQLAKVISRRFGIDRDAAKNLVQQVCDDDRFQVRRGLQDTVVLELPHPRRWKELVA